MKQFLLIISLLFSSLTFSQGIEAPDGVSLGQDVGIVNGEVNLGGVGIDNPTDNPVTPATTLLTDLKVWWDLSSVNATYSSNNLTNNNTVTFNTGKVGNAGYFTAGSPSTSLSISDNADVSLGDKDWTISGWVYLNAVASVQTILSKRDGTGSGQNEFTFIFNTASSGRLEFYQFNSGTTANAMLQSSGTISATTYYHYVIWHDNTANKLYMQVNNGTVSEVALTVTPYDGASAFKIGAQQTTNTSGMTGRVDEVSIWHRVLTSEERTYLYNSGNGRTYSGGIVQ